jgi:CarD family transcriptional regulator
MQFSVGDKIMHPRYGAGQIMGEEHRELVVGFKHYCVIKILGTGATAYIPMRKMDELGVRPIMSRAKIARVLDTLGDEPGSLPQDYKARQEQIQKKIRTCLPMQIAEAVRDLTWHKQSAKLTKVDEDLLNQGRGLLAGEIALATDSELFDAQDAIDATLKMAMADEADEFEQVQAASVALKPKPEGLIHEFLARAKGRELHAQVKD